MRRRHEARAASGEQQRGTQGPVLHHVGGTLPNGPPGSQARHRTRRSAVAAAPRAGKEPDSRREEAGEVGRSLNA